MRGTIGLASLVDPSCAPSVREQCRLLGVCRSTYYRPARGESEENLELMRIMDGHILEEPTAGVLTMQSMLRDRRIEVSEKRVRRLMRLAGLMALYPRKHLTVLGESKYIHPYLLRGLDVTAPGQVWGVDITYIPMAKGFMYLTAVIDVYSRYIVGWGTSNSLDAESCLRVIKNAVAEHGLPGILNSDQGCRFTCKEYVGYLKNKGVRISMDGKGRALDNIYIERFWRTIKRQHIYINPAKDGLELDKGIAKWIGGYHRRDHQGIGRMKPEDMYLGRCEGKTVIAEWKHVGNKTEEIQQLKNGIVSIKPEDMYLGRCEGKTVIAEWKHVGNKTEEIQLKC